MSAIEQFTTTDEFADLVNDAVPPPKPGETEDEFVRRAKSAMVELLLKKFNG